MHNHTNLLQFERLDDYKTKVYFMPSHSCIGDIILEMDGEYVFYPIYNGGYWPGWVLEEIVERLDELNNPANTAP